MAGWDYLQRMLDEGLRPLIGHRLWAEIRDAYYERESARYALWETYPHQLHEVLPRDLIEYIQTYRYDLVTRLVEMWSPKYHLWAKEVAEAGMTAYDDGGFPRWAISGTGDPSGYDLVDVFQEALGQDWFTHANRALGGYDAYFPRPALPYPDLWTDFLPLLNLKTLIHAKKFYTGPSSELWVGESHDQMDWAAARAAAWADLHYDSASGDYQPIGRWGKAYKYFVDQPYHVTVHCRPHCYYGFDLSRVWNAEHADETACDPIRLVLAHYFEFFPRPSGFPSGPTTVPVNWAVRLSSDGGETYETLREGVCSPSQTDMTGKAKGVSSDPTKWTAGSQLWHIYTGDMNADTPEWPAPEIGAPSGYGEGAEFASAAGMGAPHWFAEFDWKFKP